MCECGEIKVLVGHYDGSGIARAWATGPVNKQSEVEQEADRQFVLYKEKKESKHSGIPEGPWSKGTILYRERVKGCDCNEE